MSGALGNNELSNALFGERPALERAEADGLTTRAHASIARDMRLLYLDLGGNAGRDLELQMRYEVVFVSSYPEAMERILADHFDALVISDGREDCAMLSFFAAVHQEAPELPIFSVSNWGLDLFSALDSVMPFAPAVPLHRENTWIQ
jgi:hypothetical protein